MKAVQRIVMILVALLLLIIVFFTAIQMGIFNMRYIEREMDKLNIATAVVMEKEDLHELFRETLAYLSDDRKDLILQTVVAGESREAYNEQEKLHMVDVKGLFDGGFRIRNTSFIGLGICLAAALALKGKTTWKQYIREMAGTLMLVWGVVLLLVIVFAVMVATDFNRYFILFHHLFFDNDLWLLDPNTSLMINMLPEVFFYDMVIRIGWMFVVPYLLIVILSGVLWKRLQEKRIA